MIVAPRPKSAIIGNCEIELFGDGVDDVFAVEQRVSIDTASPQW